MQINFFLKKEKKGLKCPVSGAFHLDLRVNYAIIILSQL